MPPQNQQQIMMALVRSEAKAQAKIQAAQVAEHDEGHRGVGHLLAVLIGPGQKPDPLAPLSVPPSQNVTSSRRIRMADVWGIVDVVDRRRQVESGL